MRIPGLFRQYKPREFKYIPRYYDQQKEEFEERIRRAEEELRASGELSDDDGSDGSSETGSEEGGYRSKIRRGSFQPKIRPKQDRLNRYTPVRLAVILFILFLLAYIFWRL